MTRGDDRRVVVVHGLWMNALAMLPLAHRFARCGFEVERFGYRSVKRGLHENARRLAALCEKSGHRVHLVGHSLGGLVIMSMLQAFPKIAVQRVVLIGSPYTDIAAAHGLRRFAWGNDVIGRTIQDWLQQPRPPVPKGVELGVIAGDVSHGLGRLFVTLPEPNDGVVLLRETRVAGAADSIVVHTSHSAMLISAEVAQAACTFLKHGSFTR